MPALTGSAQYYTRSAIPISDDPCTIYWMARYPALGTDLGCVGIGKSTDLGKGYWSGAKRATNKVRGRCNSTTSTTTASNPETDNTMSQDTWIAHVYAADEATGSVPDTLQAAATWADRGTHNPAFFFDLAGFADTTYFGAAPSQGSANTLYDGAVDIAEVAFLNGRKSDAAIETDFANYASGSLLIENMDNLVWAYSFFGTLKDHNDLNELTKVGGAPNAVTTGHPIARSAGDPDLVADPWYTGPVFDQATVKRSIGAKSFFVAPVTDAGVVTYVPPPAGPGSPPPSNNSNLLIDRRPLIRPVVWPFPQRRGTRSKFS